MKEIIRPVIFIDFGGVYFEHVYPTVPRAFSKKLGIPTKKIYDAIFANWSLHATGKWNEDSYWKDIRNQLKISDKQIRQLRKAWYNSLPNEGMPQLIKKLKKKHTVVALSSIIIGWVEALEKKYKISQHFHENHYTYDHGHDKPSEKFFLSATKKMNVKPRDCIVVDDTEKFLKSVRKTGARTILFKNAKQLETQLRKMGVEV